MNITIVTCETGDWEGLYGSDGELFHQTSSIKHYVIAQYLNFTKNTISSIVYIQVESDWLDEVGQLPDLLQDIPSEFII